MELEARANLLSSVRTFASFDENNDPYGEHDFGSIIQNGCRYFWKIDAYDKTLEFASPDPGNPSVTTRVLTIMLAEEY